MKFETTDTPAEADEIFVADQTRAHNYRFLEKDVRKLSVFGRDAQGNIVAGLVGRTFWKYLEISWVWVSEQERGAGHASRLMIAAETEALQRGCRHAYLDTFSFQALGFYQKLGYTEFGRLEDFGGKHERHYLYKALRS